MALTYIGDAGRFYAAISVDGKTLEPVPGQSYDIEDPADGRWEPSGAVKADTSVITADVTKDAPAGDSEGTE